MIQVNERESALECTICGELEGVSPRALSNEAALLLLKRRVLADHADCDQWEGKPARAKAERAYKLRMRAEIHAVG